MEYAKNKHGVIYQVNPQPIKYDPTYIKDRYQAYPLSQALSHARLGYLIGSIGHIPKTICDVGYGNGDFLRACANLIPDRAGIEVNGWELPSGCEQGDYSHYYDVFTFFDSLEHFPCIHFVSTLDCKYALITVPSCNHPDDSKWFNTWKHLRPNEHLYHFNRESLARQMVEYGFVEMVSTNLEDSIRVGLDSPNTISSVFRRA